MDEFEQLFQPYLEEQQKQYEASVAYSRIADYAEVREQCEIDDKLILFTSFFGRGMICNPFALFNYCMGQDRFNGYTFVWVLDEIANHAVEINAYKDNDRIIFVEFHSREYFKYLSSAKYLINNVTEQGYFVKKDGQIVINTWHGIPLKYLGYDVPGGAYETPNSFRNFLFSDYIISPNEYMTNIYSEAYKLHDLYDGKIIETGYPRCDSLINIDKDAFIKKAGNYGVKIDPGKKVILYAPTWRGEKYASPDISMMEVNTFIKCIENAVNPDEYQVLFKPHQVVYKHLEEQGLVDETMIPPIIDANELLGVTDILISDFSSIFFDFLATGRPILFYVLDLEEYKTTRGLYFSVDELPGPVSDDENVVAGWIKGITQDEIKYAELFDYSKYEKAVSRFVPSEDGHVCARIINAIFDNDETHVKRLKTNKPRLLFHVDILKTNGITSSFLNLLKFIDYEKFDVTLNAIPPKGEPDILLSVNANVRIMCNLGGTYGTVKENALRFYCNDNCIVENDGKEIFPANAYKAEFKRRFGDCKFDCIINFSGFSSFWANVFASQKNVKQLIWMHSDLKSELENRVVNNVAIFGKGLPQIFKHFNDVDRIVGCSKAAMEINRRKLSDDNTYDKFTWVHNMIDGKRILAKKDSGAIMSIDEKNWYVDANEDMFKNVEIETELVPFPKKDHVNFVAVGRLSPEKNYDSLIRAFARLAADYDNVALYMLGDGPLKADLRKLVQECKMEGRVILTGNVSNPFAIEKACQCFVMTSFYEGMPMVILEARILGLPIIVTEFEAVKDCILEDGQLLIHTEEDSIYEGLKAYMEGKVPNKAVFDWETYNKNCVDEFNKVIYELLELN